MATYPQFPDGYNPSDFYTGNMAPPKSDGTYLRPVQNNPLGPSQGGSWPDYGYSRLPPGAPPGYPANGTIPQKDFAGLGGFYVDPHTNTLSYAEPSQTVNGITIEPFGNQYNLMDPGNEGYESYLAAQAAEGLSAAAPGGAKVEGLGKPVKTSIFDDIGAGIGSLFGASPLGRGIDALNKMGVFAPRTRPLDGTSRGGLNNSIAVRPEDRGNANYVQQARDNAEIKSGGNDGPTARKAKALGFKNEREYEKAFTSWLTDNGYTVRDKYGNQEAYTKFAATRPSVTGNTTVIGGSSKPGKPTTPGPVTPGPIPGPVTEQYDRFGQVVFPDMPPYKPGVDKEWLYFRKQLAQGGVVGYADGGPVGMDEAADPRVMAIADAEDAVEDAMSGEGIDGEGEAAIKKFVEMFGEEAMQSLVMQVQQGMKMRQRGERGRQVVGPGGPTDDAIPAVIDGTMPAALSSGEFVMPVAAVAGAGGGDVEEGARQMQALSDSFQKRTA